MKIITPGHRYELSNFENPIDNQTLQFIEKRPSPHTSDAPMETVHEGTTSEEVLRVLIDRMNHLQDKFPCRENAVVITHLETALLWLDKRTADRKARDVEGKHLA